MYNAFMYATRDAKCSLFPRLVRTSIETDKVERVTINKGILEQQRIVKRNITEIAVRKAQGATCTSCISFARPPSEIGGDSGFSCNVELLL